MQGSANDFDPIIFENFERNIQKTLARYDLLQKHLQPTGRIIMVDPGLGTRIRKTSA